MKKWRVETLRVFLRRKLHVTRRRPMIVLSRDGSTWRLQVIRK